MVNLPPTGITGVAPTTLPPASAQPNTVAIPAQVIAAEAQLEALQQNVLLPVLALETQQPPGQSGVQLILQTPQGQVQITLPQQVLANVATPQALAQVQQALSTLTNVQVQLTPAPVQGTGLPTAQLVVPTQEWQQNVLRPLQILLVNGPLINTAAPLNTSLRLTALQLPPEIAAALGSPAPVTPAAASPAEPAVAEDLGNSNAKAATLPKNAFMPGQSPGQTSVSTALPYTALSAPAALPATTSPITATPFLPQQYTGLQTTVPSTATNTTPPRQIEIVIQPLNTGTGTTPQTTVPTSAPATTPSTLQPPTAIPSSTSFFTSPTTSPTPPPPLFAPQEKTPGAFTPAAQPQQAPVPATILVSQSSGGPADKILLRTDDGRTFLLPETATHGVAFKPGDRVAVSIAPTNDGPVPDTVDARPPAITDALSALRTLAPAFAQQAIAQLVMQPSAPMQGTLLFLLTAMGSSLGTTATQAANSKARATELVEAMSRAADGKLPPALASRLLTEFQTLAGGTTHTLDQQGYSWHTAPLPTLMQQGMAAPFTLYVQQRQDEPGQQGSGAATSTDARKTRFVVDLHLTQLGHTQLEGLSRARQTDKAGQLDLALKTETQLPPALQNDLINRYTEIMAATGLTGTLSFMRGPFLTFRATGFASSV